MGGPLDTVATVQDHASSVRDGASGPRTAASAATRWDVESCAGCCDDAGYFRSILKLTAQRLEAVRRLRLTVLSSFMPRELIQAGIPADHVSVVRSRRPRSRVPGARRGLSE